MSSRVELLKSKNLISPPKWLPPNVHYEVQGGSTSYGVAGESSDMDIVGFCIPPKDQLFPHLRGEIPGFGKQIQRFGVWQEHHIQDKEARLEYDFSIYNIVNFFQLAMDNNPNIVDALFVPERCVLFCSRTAQILRDNKKMFLHKGSYQKMRGYAYSQKHKLSTKEHWDNEKRRADMEAIGYSTKYAYHLIRLLLEAEQILIEHDLDITKNRELLKSIRRREWPLEKLLAFFDEKEKGLEELYIKSTLQHSPDEERIKTLLMSCLEDHYGSLTDAVKVEVPVEKLIAELKLIVERFDK